MLLWHSIVMTSHYFALGLLLLPFLPPYLVHFQPLILSLIVIDLHLLILKLNLLILFLYLLTISSSSCFLLFDRLLILPFPQVQLLNLLALLVFPRHHLYVFLLLLDLLLVLLTIFDQSL